MTTSMMSLAIDAIFGNYATRDSFNGGEYAVPYMTLTDFTRLLNDAPGLQSSLLAIDRTNDASSIWFKCKPMDAPGLRYEDFLIALQELAIMRFPDEDSGVAYAHFLATHIFKIPNIVLSRPSSMSSGGGSTAITEHHHHRTRTTTPPYGYEYRRSSLRPIDNNMTVNLSNNNNLAYSRINYSGLSHPPYERTSPSSSSSSSSSAVQNTNSTLMIDNRNYYDTNNNTTSNGLIGGIPVTPIQIGPFSRTSLYPPSNFNPPPSYPSSLPSHASYAPVPSTQPPQPLMYPYSVTDPSATMIPSNEEGVPMNNGIVHHPGGGLVTPSTTIIHPPTNQYTSQQHMVHSPPSSSSIPWNALPVIQYSPRDDKNLTPATSSVVPSVTPSTALPGTNNNSNDTLTQVLTSPSIAKSSSTTNPPPFASPFQTHRLLLRQTISRIYKRSRERVIRRYFQRWYDNAHAITVQIQSRKMVARTAQDVKGISTLVSAMDKIALRQQMRRKHSAFTKWYTNILKIKAYEHSQALENRTEQERQERNRIEQIAQNESIAKNKAEQDKYVAEQEKERAEQGKVRAEQEKVRAEEERQRAEQAKHHAEEAKKKAEEAKHQADEAKRKMEEDKRRAEEDKRKMEEMKQKIEKEKLTVEQSKSALEKESAERMKVAKEAQMQAKHFSSLFRLSVCGMVISVFLLVLFMSILFPLLLSSSTEPSVQNDLWMQTVKSYPWLRYIVDIQTDETEKQRCLRIFTFRTSVCIPTMNTNDLMLTNDTIRSSSATVTIPTSVPAVTTAPYPVTVDTSVITPLPPTYTVTSGGDIVSSLNNNGSFDDEEEDWCSSPFGTCGLENVAM